MNAYKPAVVRKAIGVLRFVTGQDKPVGVSEISRSLGLNKSTAFGILKALEEEDLIEQDRTTRCYRPAAGLRAFAREALLVTDFTALVRPLMEGFSELVGETVCMGIIEEDKVNVVEVVEARKEVGISTAVGTRFSIMTPALLKVYLSTMKDEEIFEYMRGRPLPHYTDKSITDMKLLLQEVKTARQNGYALNLEEFREGVRAITAPVFSGERLKGLLWVVGLSSSLPDSMLPKVITHLLDTARHMSDILSGAAG